MVKLDRSNLEIIVIWTARRCVSMLSRMSQHWSLVQIWITELWILTWISRQCSFDLSGQRCLNSACASSVRISKPGIRFWTTKFLFISLHTELIAVYSILHSWNPSLSCVLHFDLNCARRMSLSTCFGFVSNWFLQSVTVARSVRPQLLLIFCAKPLRL